MSSPHLQRVQAHVPDERPNPGHHHVVGAAQHCRATSRMGASSALLASLHRSTGCAACASQYLRPRWRCSAPSLQAPEARPHDSSHVLTGSGAP